MKPPRITSDEWLKELRAITLNHRDSDGMSSREIAAKMGCSVDVVLERLRAAKQRGILRTGKKMYEGVDGRIQHQTVYWIEPRKSDSRRRSFMKSSHLTGDD